VPDGGQVMLKLSITTVDDFYADLVGHSRALRVVARPDRVAGTVIRGATGSVRGGNVSYFSLRSPSIVQFLDCRLTERPIRRPGNAISRGPACLFQGRHMYTTRN
jgi:hypothetical protein